MIPNTNINFDKVIEDIEGWLGEIKSKELQIRSALESLKAYKKAVDEVEKPKPLNFADLPYGAPGDTKSMDCRVDKP